MGTMTQTIGLKLRRIRLKRGYSQEALADRAGLHPTYIGQVERGEKNITVESLSKITTALGIPISAAFDDLPPQVQTDENYPLQAYQLFSSWRRHPKEGLWDLGRDPGPFIAKRPQREREHSRPMLCALRSLGPLCSFFPCHPWLDVVI